MEDYSKHIASSSYIKLQVDTNLVRGMDKRSLEVLERKVAGNARHLPHRSLLLVCPSSISAHAQEVQ